MSIMGESEPNRPQLAQRPTPTRHQRYSRWQSSEITFGPVGRTVATAVLAIPILFAIFVNVVFVVAAGIWLVGVLPIAYRDVWRKVRATRTPADDLADEFRRAFPDDGPAKTDIATREMPSRW